MYMLTVFLNDKPIADYEYNTLNECKYHAMHISSMYAFRILSGTDAVLIDSRTA